jgi:hypothetical protein
MIQPLDSGRGRPVMTSCLWWVSAGLQVVICLTIRDAESTLTA